MHAIKQYSSKSNFDEFGIFEVLRIVLIRPALSCRRQKGRGEVDR